jgi:hypothetical protein
MTASAVAIDERRRRARDFGMSVPPFDLSTRLCTNQLRTRAHTRGVTASKLAAFRGSRSTAFGRTGRPNVSFSQVTRPLAHDRHPKVTR